MNGYAVFNPKTKTRSYINNHGNYFEKSLDNCIVKTIKEAFDLIIKCQKYKTIIEFCIFENELKERQHKHNHCTHLEITTIKDGKDTNEYIDYDREEVRRKIIQSDKETLKDIVFNKKFYEPCYHDRKVIDYLNSDLYAFTLTLDKSVKFDLDNASHSVRDFAFDWNDYIMDGATDINGIVLLKLKYGKVAIKKFSEIKDTITEIYPDFFKEE